MRNKCTGGNVEGGGEGATWRKEWWQGATQTARTHIASLKGRPHQHHSRQPGDRETAW